MESSPQDDKWFASLPDSLTGRPEMVYLPQQRSVGYALGNMPPAPVQTESAADREAWDARMMRRQGVDRWPTWLMVVTWCAVLGILLVVASVGIATR